MPKQPYFPFYPGDWLRDSVSGCSVAAQGLWLRILMVMHDSERKGYLCTNGLPTPPEQVARRCGLSLDEYTSLFTELEQSGVPRRTNDGIIFNRKMVEDARISGERSKAGSVIKGSNKSSIKGETKAQTKSNQNAEDENEDEGSKPLLFDNELSEQDAKELAVKLYAMFPRKEARPIALKAIEKALAKASFETLAAGIQKYIVDCTRNNTTYTHPATWFNQERWTDEKRDSKPPQQPKDLYGSGEDLENFNEPKDPDLAPPEMWGGAA